LKPEPESMDDCYEFYASPDRQKGITPGVKMAEPIFIGFDLSSGHDEAVYSTRDNSGTIYAYRTQELHDTTACGYGGQRSEDMRREPQDVRPPRGRDKPRH